MRALHPVRRTSPTGVLGGTIRRAAPAGVLGIRARGGLGSAVPGVDRPSGAGWLPPFGLERPVACPEALIERLEKVRVRLIGHVERLECGRPGEIPELAVELTEVVPSGVRSLAPRLGCVTRGSQVSAPRHLLAVLGGNRHCPCGARRRYNTRVCGYCPAKPGSGHVVARRVGQLHLLLADEALDLGPI